MVFVLDHGGLCAAQTRAQRCTYLVGKCDSNHSWLEWYLVAGRRSENEAAQNVSTVLNQELDLGPGEPHALHAPHPATEQHVPVVLKTHHGTSAQAHLVPAGSEVE